MPLDVSSFRLLLLYFRYFDLFCCALIFLGGSPPNICFWRLTSEMTTTPPTSTSTTESQDFDYIFACVFIDVLSFSMVVTVALLHFFFLFVLFNISGSFSHFVNILFIYISLCVWLCVYKQVQQMSKKYSQIEIKLIT